MDLHELKIWIDGFSKALPDNLNKQQWQTVLKMIASAEDASTVRAEQSAKLAAGS